MKHTPQKTTCSNRRPNRAFMRVLGFVQMLIGRLFSLMILRPVAHARPQAQGASTELVARIDRLIANGSLSPAAASQLKQLLFGDDAIKALPNDFADRLCAVLEKNHPTPLGERSHFQCKAADNGTPSSDDTLLLANPFAGSGNLTSQMIERANQQVLPDSEVAWQPG